MPVQKGKRRKRPRSRGSGLPDAAYPPTTGAAPVAHTRKVARGTRRRFEFPLWANFAFGIGLLVLGVVFGITPQKGYGGIPPAVIVVLYVAAAAIYLSKAYRQYRSRAS